MFAGIEFFIKKNDQYEGQRPLEVTDRNASCLRVQIRIEISPGQRRVFSPEKPPAFRNQRGHVSDLRKVKEIADDKYDDETLPGQCPGHKIQREQKQGAGMEHESQCH